MKNNQFIEGLFPGECRKCGCDRGCCDNGRIEEWIVEFFQFHEKIKDCLISKGVKIDFFFDRVKFNNCLGNGECKFLQCSIDENSDPRPIDCKIYPYVVDWDNIDWDNKIVNLTCNDTNCPIIKDQVKTEELEKEAEKVIKRDFAKIFGGAEFKVEFFRNSEFKK